MVLILLGPLVTRAQLFPQPPPGGHSQNTTQHEAASEHHHAHHQGHHHSQAPQPEPGRGEAGQHSSDSPLEHLAHGECGYCWLLVKLPVISSQSSTTAWQDIAATPPPLADSRSQSYREPRYAKAPVRAPPFMV